MLAGDLPHGHTHRFRLARRRVVPCAALPYSPSGPANVRRLGDHSALQGLRDTLIVGADEIRERNVPVMTVTDRWVTPTRVLDCGVKGSIRMRSGDGETGGRDIRVNVTEEGHLGAADNNITRVLRLYHSISP